MSTCIAPPIPKIMQAPSVQGGAADPAIAAMPAIFDDPHLSAALEQLWQSQIETCPYPLPPSQRVQLFRQCALLLWPLAQHSQVCGQAESVLQLSCTLMPVNARLSALQVLPSLQLNHAKLSVQRQQLIARWVNEEHDHLGISVSSQAANWLLLPFSCRELRSQLLS